MKLSFKRITSSGSFIPEIDGLRFIAVSSVVLYHFWCFYNVKDLNTYTDNIDYSFLVQVLSHGNFGVPLFFVISGLILGIPFAKFHLTKGKPVQLKNYFLRRLTRLEPPYIVAMTGLFLGALFIAHTITFEDGLPKYLTSLIYINNFVYPGMKANGVAWSLEIEVQFYILAPLMGYLFAIRQINFRRLLIFSIAVAFMLFNYFNPFHFISLLNYAQYFLLGFLMADLYVSKATLLPKTKFDSLIAFICFCAIWLFERGDFDTIAENFLWEFVQLLCVFVMYYYILFHNVFRFLSLRLITNIGGMCYSIYLLHYYIISAFGNPLMNFRFSEYSFINVTIYTLILMVPIVILCSLFFLLIERPCMDKDWYKKIFNRQRIAPAAK